ncbi:hypothetical protein [Streptomyces sp. NPDC004629]|uniref:hypothetical protein n=1 Tax=Streptomyces sp. NPDC004629 TaxID=3364705 RepID=UPI0036812295
MSTPPQHWTARLYPPARRHEFADEVSTAIAQVEAERGRWAGTVERAAVVGHALRLRTRLDSARPGGRLLAAAAPAVIAVSAALSASLLVVWQLPPLPWDGEPGYTPAAYAPWIAVLICALAARWTAARISAGLALLGALLSLPLVYWTDGADGLAQNRNALVGLALAALFVLAVPPDLPPVGPRARRTMALSALAMGVPMVAGSITVFETLASPDEFVDARADPFHLLFFFTPLVFAIPLALAVARSRYAPALAALLLGAAVFGFAPTIAPVIEIPYGTRGLWAQASFATGLIALIAYCVRAVRERRRGNPVATPDGTR